MKRLAIVMVGLVVVGCSSPRNTMPVISELYRDSARRYVRNPVIVLHGILGARLEEQSTGRTVWGAFTGSSIDPATPDGARALALPMQGDLPAMNLDVRATGPLGAIQLGLFFTVINVGVYANILRSLGIGGYTDNIVVDPSSPSYSEDHYTCWSFFYDWRRDCVDNAIAFGDFLVATRARIERSAADRVEELRAAGGPDALQEAAEIEDWLGTDWRFDVVAHSMGGLLARYYLRYGALDLPHDGAPPEVTWAGARQIDRLVMVGTPNLGSMDALKNLVEGFRPAPLLPHYDAAILGTMTAIYQLLPRNGMGLVLDADGNAVDFDLFDVDHWDRNGWGLLCADSTHYLEWLLPTEQDPDRRRARARAVLAQNLERARQFHCALDQDAPRPCPAEVRLFAADTIPTIARTRLELRDGRLVPCFDGDGLTEYGDMTVPRFSALADRKMMARGPIDSPIGWDSATFLPDDHIGITQNPLFTNNLLFYLLQQDPRPRR